MDAVASVSEKNQFELMAYVILPDHFHALIDPQKCNLSNLMKRIKMSFAAKYRIKTNSKGRIWQYRFWDHIIRNQKDLNHHLDYIHYNPVKHGITSNPFDYDNSSLHKYYKDGYYTKDWGIGKEFNFGKEYGE